MKKIVSLLLVVGMLAAMMVSVSAFNGDSTMFLYSDVTEVTVGDTFQVKVGFTGDTDPAGKLKGGKVVVSATANASFDAAEAGDAVSAYATQNLSTSTGVLQIVESSAATMVSGDGDYAVLTFTALEAGTFTLSTTTVNVQFIVPSTTNKTVHKTALAPLNITIKDAAPADPTVYGDAAACEKEWTAVKNANTTNTNTYTNVAVATAKCPATATAAGFMFGKTSDVADTAEKKAVAFDAETVDGEGNIEYTAVMYGVEYSDALTAIYALPYYVPAN